MPPLPPAMARIATALTMLAACGLTHAATLGAPVLESGLGESLRIIFPVIPSGRDRLTVDCVKLRSGAEINDISDGVRANIVTTGDRQAVVLTTVKPVNELVISVGVSLECGAFFLRRYTFLLDLPPAERRGAAAAGASVAAPLASSEGSAVPSAPDAGISAPGDPRAPKGATGTAAATGAAGAAAPARRSGATPFNANRGSSKAAGNAGGLAQVPTASVMRPQDEPGVLPRGGRNARANQTAQTPLANRAAQVARPPLAPPVRSMLKIELGGIDEFLASQPRLLLEQSTGMRLATDISAPDRQSAASIAADRGFKQAHARYIASMRDAPDPLSTENEALGKRLDGFSKDLASLKLDLQTTRARADALEASRVPWWWLLIAAAVAALVAGAGAAWWLRRMERRPSGPLIDVESVRWGKSDATADGAAKESPYKRDFTATVAMTRAERARRIARGEPDPDAVPSAPPAPAPEPEAAVEPAAVVEMQRDNSDDLVSFNLPRFDQPTKAPPAVEKAIAAASNAIAAAVASRTVAAADAPPPVPVKVDKNSLTQQLAAMEDLSDEAWASYRHPSDPSSVAAPFGAPAASAASADGLQINFSLDPEPKQTSTALAEVRLDEPGGDAGMISTSDISALTGPPAQSDGQRARTSVTPGSGLQTSITTRDGAPFTLEILDPPPTLKASGSASGITLAPMEPSAPDSAESEKMREVMTAASNVMETVHKLVQEGHPGGALRALGAYLEAAPPQAPPGPWVQLAHTLHEVGMQEEYAEAQQLFKERFGADLPGWDAAEGLKRHQMGMARVTGIEIMVAAGRGKPELIGRLAGLAYRVAVPPEVLFDVLMHRELLQQVAQTQVASAHSTDTGSDHVDISL